MSAEKIEIDFVDPGQKLEKLRLTDIKDKLDQYAATAPGYFEAVTRALRNAPKVEYECIITRY